MGRVSPFPCRAPSVRNNSFGAPSWRDRGEGWPSGRLAQVIVPLGTMGTCAETRRGRGFGSAPEATSWTPRRLWFLIGGVAEWAPGASHRAIGHDGNLRRD